MPLRGKTWGGGTASSTAVLEIEPLSLIGLRRRAVRFWLAGLSLLGFAVAYVGPLVAAFELPAVSSPAIVTPLPALTLPTVTFTGLKVPKVSPPVRQAAMPERSAAPTPRVSQQSAAQASARPVPQTRSAAAEQVPVVTDQYTLDPAAATAASPAPAA